MSEMDAKRTGVFISHITEEASVALVLRRYLIAAFGDSFRVFVSSDKESIEAGDEWYQGIIKGLTGVQTVIVLLSQESVRRGWIKFEAGVGRDADAKVIPMVLNRYSLSQVPFPLAGLQGRQLDDLGFVIDSIAKREGIAPAPINIEAYQTEVGRAKADLNYRSLVVTPIMNGHALEFDIENVGNVDLELLMLEVLIPAGAIDPRWVPPRYVEFLASRRIEGRDYNAYELYSPRGALNTPPALRPVITPSMGRYRTQFSVRLDFSQHNTVELRRFWFQLHAVGYATQMESRAFLELTW